MVNGVFIMVGDHRLNRCAVEVVCVWGGGGESGQVAPHLAGPCGPTDPPVSED